MSASKGQRGTNPGAAPEADAQPARAERRSEAPRRRASIHVALAKVIGTRIVRGDYPAGSILPSEAAWAAEFDVSRSAIRESVKMLLGKGLLTSRPKIGSRVEPQERWNLLDHDVLNWYAGNPGRKDFLRSLQVFRGIFEPEAAALAAENRSEAQMQRISEACAAMGKAQSLAERSAADVRFHMAILEASGNELLLPLGSLIGSALDHLFLMITREAGSLRHAQELHEAIERAIRRQNPAAARRAVKKLMANSDAMVDQIVPESLDRSTADDD